MLRRARLPRVCLLRWPWLFAFLAVVAAGRPSCAGQQTNLSKPAEKLHDIVSRQRLMPPLRSDSLVRFSPDGRHLLVENSEGIYLLTTSPLKLVAYIAVPFTYGAAFSEDSQSLRTVTMDLRVANWSVENGHHLFSLKLPLEDGCLSARLSPDGNLFACIRPSGAISIYRVSDGRAVLSEPSKSNSGVAGPAVIALGEQTPMATPLGFVLGYSRAVLANTGHVQLPMFFSPDAEDFIVVDSGVGNRIGLATHKKSAFHSEAVRPPFSVLLRLDGDRLLVSNSNKQGALEIRSLASNAILQNLPAAADAATRASDSRYLILQNFEASGFHVFDLKDNRAMDVPSNAGLDILGSEMALWTETGNLFLYRLGDTFPYRATQLPLDYLAPLRSALADPQLQTLVFSTARKTRIFSVSDGKQIGALSGVDSSSAVDADSLHFVARGRGTKSEFALARLDLASKQTSVVASANDSVLRAGSGAIIGYSAETAAGSRMGFGFDGGSVPFRLRASDPRSGAELWKKSFQANCPVPFADPQGERLVLGWRAQDYAARKTADRNPEVKNLFKKTKINALDSFFEVIDAKSGTSLGGALLQVGGTAATYESAFSEGQALVLLKDEKRVSLYSLTTGTLVARLTGTIPAASGAARLLALSGGNGRLLLHDLNSGAKLDEQLFPDDIVYMHFSEDGTRLLVLTAHQMVFVVAVNKIPRTLASGSR
ncbi:MAG TPA: WD40 repeat domain-containing protein [Candidatus Saccharimonadales bacterium]|nr:WD40 repeat domain-containing protein [Candidatus Saccharimonadales bacterium]